MLKTWNYFVYTFTYLNSDWNTTSKCGCVLLLPRVCTCVATGKAVERFVCRLSTSIKANEYYYYYYYYYCFTATIAEGLLQDCNSLTR